MNESCQTYTQVHNSCHTHTHKHTYTQTCRTHTHTHTHTPTPDAAQRVYQASYLVISTGPSQSSSPNTLCCSVLQRVAVCCSVLQCVAVCCGVRSCDFDKSITIVVAKDPVLQRVAVHRSVLQCVAVCCSIRSCGFDKDIATSSPKTLCCSMLQCVAVCCSVLRRVILWFRQSYRDRRRQIPCVAAC